MKNELSIYLCDDNPIFTEEISENIARILNNKRKYDLTLFDNGRDLINKWNQYFSDVVFLDIDMPDLDGFVVAEKLQKSKKNALIIFVTSHTKYMQDCFECSPFRFLVKPVSDSDFDKVFDDILKKLSEERTTFVFTENRNKVRLFCEDIVYFECQGHYIHIFTKDKTHKICKTMAELYANIDKSMFLKVHKYFVINLNYVREIKESEIILYDSQRIIPISRTFKKQVATAFINFKERKYRI